MVTAQVKRKLELSQSFRAEQLPRVKIRGTEIDPLSGPTRLQRRLVTIIPTGSFGT